MNQLAKEPAWPVQSHGLVHVEQTPRPRSQALEATAAVAPAQAQDLVSVDPDQQREVERFLLPYRCGLREVLTKVEILREEFATMHLENPIEHVASRMKSLSSIMAKDAARGGNLSPSSIHERVKDIAGIRVTCGFIPDVYRLHQMLAHQPDLTICETKDYIASPKPSGYRSLHLVVTVPVFLSASVMHVPVEIQLRTVAMDFWASLEHKMAYKGQVRHLRRSHRPCTGPPRAPTSSTC